MASKYIPAGSKVDPYSGPGHLGSSPPRLLAKAALTLVDPVEEAEEDSKMSANKYPSGNNTDPYSATDKGDKGDKDKKPTEQSHITEVLDDRKEEIASPDTSMIGSEYYGQKSGDKSGGSTKSGQRDDVTSPDTSTIGDAYYEDKDKGKGKGQKSGTGEGKSPGEGKADEDGFIHGSVGDPYAGRSIKAEIEESTKAKKGSKISKI